uniref:Kinectin 1 n=1 Tax=Leptobrachium leishanense TaxID=445787 RepID=A0A8C5QD55_9ANUR
MEFYESTYFIILIPSVVIAMIFLFFWLFMKETSYDEVLAKQKKDLKLPPLKVDKKKVEKKKNKKKESQNGHLHESDSETANREFDLMDALSSEEEHVVPAPVIEAEPAVNVRERKKKDKKPPKLVTEEPAGKEINGTKPPGKKAELVPVTKQPTPPIDASGSKKKQGAKKLKNGTVVPSTKKQEPPSPPADVKPQESGSGKKRITAKKQKIDTLSALVNEPLIQAAVYVPLMDNTAEQVVEKKVEKEAAVRADPAEGPPRGGGKKAKAVTDKENAEVKFKDVVSAMRSLTLSEEEAMAVMETLKEKSRAVQEIVRKVRLLSFLEPHAPLCLGFSLRWEFIRTRLSDGDLLVMELLGEKQKSNLMEAKARERIAAMEKEHGVFQSKMHSSYQDAQQMQLKFQQVREQLETQLGHLKQENSILRDAVSSATNQMESKQSGELNKLRQDCTRLVNELAEKNNKMVQEEMQKKSSEQVASQLKAQIQEAERRVEEAETYLRSRLAECDVIQQDMQGKLLTKESEIQTLHSKFTDTMVSNQQLEQRILQLMEASQSEGLQMHIQDLLKQNEALNLQIQKYHSQMHAQVTPRLPGCEAAPAGVLSPPPPPFSMQEKEDKIKTVEELLEAGLIEMANKEEELRVCAAPVCLPALRCPVPPLCACWLCFAVSDPLCVFSSLSDKDAQIEALREEAESLKSALEQQRKKNNDLREKNWKAMDALASTEKMLQNKVNKTAKVTPLSARREHFYKEQPRMSSILDHRGVFAGGGCRHTDLPPRFLQVLEQKLKEGEEIHSLLQLECEKYKSVLAETEGILQRLQRSVEEEEGRWKVKVEESQKELKEVCGVSVCVCLCLCLCLRKEREHLETELEKAEHDRASYVSEVREVRRSRRLPAALTPGSGPSGRSRDPVWVYRVSAVPSLIPFSVDLMGISCFTSQEPQEPREKTLQSLSQSVTRLQQCLQALNQQLTKGREHYQVIGKITSASRTLNPL